MEVDEPPWSYQGGRLTAGTTLVTQFEWLLQISGAKIALSLSW